MINSFECIQPAIFVLFASLLLYATRKKLLFISFLLNGSFLAILTGVATGTTTSSKRGYPAKKRNEAAQIVANGVLNFTLILV